MGSCAYDLGRLKARNLPMTRRRLADVRVAQWRGNRERQFALFSGDTRRPVTAAGPAAARAIREKPARLRDRPVETPDGPAPLMVLHA